MPACSLRAGRKFSSKRGGWFSPPASRTTWRNILDVMDGGVELFAYGREDFFRFLVISRANLRARFLQALLLLGHRGPWRAQFLRRHPCRLGAFDTRPRLVRPPGHFLAQ